MFSRILIANRGEIACRIIQTAQQMGIHCIAVYSEADANSQHVKCADEAHLLGPAQSTESYLKVDTILQIALNTGAQAIHPGYGFLSENAEFATACQANGIAFIGPGADAISAMGSKSAAKEIMSKADVPLVPGYHGDDQDPKLLKAQAEKCGFPLLLKAVAGGGGKGMRVVESLDDFDQALVAAQREAQNAFGNSTMLLERFMSKTRHIEVQVFCDSFGNGIYLSQRDCSIQRRHQKIVEEAPAPGISPSVVEAMGIAALNAAKAINYVGAGTVEFLFNEDDSFYFMEMNTRLQVEHPVTEMVTQVDLVKWQLSIAYGEALPMTQADVTVTGHALECRIYAEDPSNSFLPATGTLNYLRTPRTDSTVRIDTGVIEGDEVSVYYDPMISKLIVWGEDRAQAVNKMAKALLDYRIVGVKNNIPFLHKVITSDAFSDLPIDTQFIEKNESVLFSQDYDYNQVLAIASCTKILFESAALANDSAQLAPSPFASASQWRMNQISSRTILWLKDPAYTEFNEQDSSIYDTIEVKEPLANLPSGASFGSEIRSFEVTVDKTQYHIQASLEGDQLNICVNGQQLKLQAYSQQLQLNLFYAGAAIELHQPDFSGDTDSDQHQGALSAPMNGRVIAVLVKPGDSVAQGDPLIIIEAMKMEHTITALADGEVSDVYFAESELVAEGETLIAMDTKEQ